MDPKDEPGSAAKQTEHTAGPAPLLLKISGVCYVLGVMSWVVGSTVFDAGRPAAYIAADFCLIGSGLFWVSAYRELKGRLLPLKLSHIPLLLMTLGPAIGFIVGAVLPQWWWGLIAGVMLTVGCYIIVAVEIPSDS